MRVHTPWGSLKITDFHSAYVVPSDRRYALWFRATLYDKVYAALLLFYDREQDAQAAAMYLIAAWERGDETLTLNRQDELQAPTPTPEPEWDDPFLVPWYR